VEIKNVREGKIREQERRKTKEKRGGGI